MDAEDGRGRRGGAEVVTLGVKRHAVEKLDKLGGALGLDGRHVVRLNWLTVRNSSEWAGSRKLL